MLRVDLLIVTCLIPATTPNGELDKSYLPVKESARVIEVKLFAATNSSWIL